MGGLHLGEHLASYVPCEPGCQESTAASASLSRGSFSSQDTEFPHFVEAGKLERRESSQFSLLGCSYCCFIHPVMDSTPFPHSKAEQNVSDQKLDLMGELRSPGTELAPKASVPLKPSLTQHSLCQIQQLCGHRLSHFV